MKASRVILEALKREGVDTIFGFPGGQVIPLYDALYDFDINHMLVRHEQGAGHAADGYARASGKVGVCLATSGPGATNLVTAIANAYMDSVPMVAITGQVSRHLIGLDSFQEADITGITLPIVKHSYLVKRAEDLTRIIREAFYIAGTGRPGPVLIDLPVDVTKEEIDFDPDELPAMKLPGYKPTFKGHPKQIREAARVIAAAQRPVIYAGGGVITADASEELRELALYGHIPVTTTLTGKGCFPEDHDLSMGMLGMHGTQYANYAVSQADLIVAVGVRFDDRVTGSSGRLRASGFLRARGRRPGRDQQERGRGRAHRGRRQAGARVLARRAEEARPQPGTAPALDGAGRDLEEGSSAGGAAGRGRRDHARVGHQQDLGSDPR